MTAPQPTAVSRLTENEKVCLRRWLDHQTAKEMAIDLGISPHAVEKRLKMARAKLGVSSSLEAARLLAAHERKGTAENRGYQPADLDHSSIAVETQVQRRPWRSYATGGTIMLILAGLALFQTVPTNEQLPNDKAPPPERVAASAEQVTAFLGDSFDILDRDHSGFLEASEMPPVQVRVGSPGNLRAVDQAAARAMWMERGDTDGDGRISKTEYIAASRPPFDHGGIPADWKPRSKRGD